MDIHKQIGQLRCNPIGMPSPAVVSQMVIERVKAADTMEKLLSAVVELWTVADTSDLDTETALFVGGCVAKEMERDQTRREPTDG